MGHTRVMFVAAVLAFILGGLPEELRKSEDVPRITKEQFRSMLGSQDVVIIDVRTQKQWSYNDQKIPGAVYENPNDVESWAHKYPKGKTLVLCGTGPAEATSARVARQLMTMGLAKFIVLKDGFTVWAEAGFPLEKKTSLKEACIDCHANLSPGIVSEWQQSKHQQNEVLCLVCHGDQHESEQDVAKAVIPGIGEGKRCHEAEADPGVSQRVGCAVSQNPQSQNKIEALNFSDNDRIALWKGPMLRTGL